MYLPKNASKLRQREAQNARDNRAEIVTALNSGQITKRDLFRWGIFTAAGVLAEKNGLSPFAKSAYAAVPTGTPLSPLFGAQKFTAPMQRLNLQTPIPLTSVASIDGTGFDAAWGPLAPNEPAAKRLSWHNNYSALPSGPTNPYRNKSNDRGPMEGRPPGEYFAHQRWDEFFPKVGYVMTLGSQKPNTTRFHSALPAQDPNSVWSFGSGSFRSSASNTPANGVLPAPLIRARYGEPMICRIYNGLPSNPTLNRGFGRNESSLHFHNAHNGAESDGACNAYHFPGTFYDYRWSTTLARRDKINQGATDNRASGPFPELPGGLKLVSGDYRELQGTMWYHDHRFFYTAENVYKGSAGMINYYSGPDRGAEHITDGVNLKLPSGYRLDWGNIDFDVNLLVSDAATDPAGQLFFDIFTTDGFLGDILMVNHQYAPYMEILPRKYRFRILNACMSRFIRLALADQNGTIVPFQMIANDGNLLVNPVNMTSLEEQGVAERYDIVVDFSRFPIGSKVRLINVLRQVDGRLPAGAVTIPTALAGVADDPAVGAILEFRVVGSVLSVDDPSKTNTGAPSAIIKPLNGGLPLTAQIPVVAPVRERVVEFVKANGDSRDPNTGKCLPDCPNGMPFPWSITINGQPAHSMNANRISLLIPRPGEVEHWTYINPGSGWDHPIHLHFEEGITIDRGTGPISAAEKLVRKDVWRLRPQGRVKFQVQFGEYGGSYVNHCHNTVHEDFAMLLRYQILGNAGTPQLHVTPTPIPSLDGVTFNATPPEILPEGLPPGTTI
jgi:FtsP/CotA-like multicopper oxidase with cupredoxin domain